LVRILYATARRVDRYLINALKELNHVVDVSGRVEDATAMAAFNIYDAIFCDTASPYPAWVARLASARPNAFVISIFDAGGHDGRAATLRAGADACFARPLHIGEVASKLVALARRAHRAAPDGPVRLLPGRRAVLVNGHTIPLSRHEYVVLEMMSARPGEVFSTERISHALWGADEERDPVVVRACVSRLRTKVEGKFGRRLIFLRRGRGYVYEIDDNLPEAGAPV